MIWYFADIWNDLLYCGFTVVPILGTTVPLYKTKQKTVENEKSL